MSTPVFSHDPAQWHDIVFPDKNPEHLLAANAKLVGALDMIRETLNGGNVDDLLYIINTALEENSKALALAS